MELPQLQPWRAPEHRGCRLIGRATCDRAPPMTFVLTVHLLSDRQCSGITWDNRSACRNVVASSTRQRNLPVVTTTSQNATVVHTAGRVAAFIRLHCWRRLLHRCCRPTSSHYGFPQSSTPQIGVTHCRAAGGAAAEQQPTVKVVNKAACCTCFATRVAPCKHHVIIAQGGITLSSGQSNNAMIKTMMCANNAFVSLLYLWGGRQLVGAMPS
jgi:hypothetical protein